MGFFNGSKYLCHVNGIKISIAELYLLSSDYLKRITKNIESSGSV